MNLRIAPTTLPLTPTQVARRVAAPQESTQDNAQDVGFSHAFKHALHTVSAAQQRAERLQNEVQLENPDVGIEETMVAMQKANIGFQATLHVRNRLVQAYSDIMNMQV